MTSSQVRVGIVGATGYAGNELLRIFSSHRNAKVTYAASTQADTAYVSDTAPELVGYDSLRVESFDADECHSHCDFAFVALPSGASGNVSMALRQRGMRVIDLSGDFRLPAQLYESWYGKPALVHHPNDVEAVYGLTEWNQSAIQSAQLVANPGCYATAALLALLPIVEAKWHQADHPLVIDAKSGVSGSGRKPTRQSHFAELQENFYAYKVGGHQHTPEIQHCLGLSAPHSILLTTQLLPCTRGIFLTAYVPLNQVVTDEDVHQTFLKHYQTSPFLTIYPSGKLPQMKQVRGSNRCHIGFHVHETHRMLQVFSTIDNLQKGASGQAVQNFNVMHGFSETEGLLGLPLYP